MDIQQAHEIMGKNFFGVEEAVKHFGVSPSAQELAHLADIPFSEETLKGCHYNHVLVAVFELSIVEMRTKFPDKIYYGNRLWNANVQGEHCFHKTYARNRGKVGWHLMRKNEVWASTDKMWWRQQMLLSMNEKTPNTRVVVYSMIISDALHGLFNRSGWHDNKIAVRCSDRASDSTPVVVFGPGYWGGGHGDGWDAGICIAHSHNEASCWIGLASERKW